MCNFTLNFFCLSKPVVTYYVDSGETIDSIVPSGYMLDLAINHYH